MSMCIYCRQCKPEDDMSLEHIWPAALGGNALPEPWQTLDVCRKCNNASGLFVDGEFIKGVFGSFERSAHHGLYVRDETPTHVVVPLHFRGTLDSIPSPQGEIADFWMGRCGEHVIHIRPQEQQDVWRFSVGGDPRWSKSTATAGRVYVALASKEPFWIHSCLASVEAHFKKADLFVVNTDIPVGHAAFKSAFESDLSRRADMDTVKAVQKAFRDGQGIRNRLRIRTDAGTRLLAKIGIAMGHKTLGAAFAETEYAKTLRQALWEADAEKRAALRIKGVGYFKGTKTPEFPEILGFRSAWVLLVQAIDDHLLLSVITPMCRTMAIVISDEPQLVRQIGPRYDSGLVWVTVPSLGRSVGPLSFPDYAGHQTGDVLQPELSEVTGRWVDYCMLPPCK